MTVKFTLALALCCGVIGWVARAELEPNRAGLSRYYQLFREKNAYEGKFECQSACTIRLEDAGLYPKLVRESDDNAHRCIEKLIERSKKECPRIGW